MHISHDSRHLRPTRKVGTAVQWRTQGWCVAILVAIALLTLATTALKSSRARSIRCDGEAETWGTVDNLDALTGHPMAVLCRTPVGATLCDFSHKPCRLSNFSGRFVGSDSTGALLSFHDGQVELYQVELSQTDVHLSRVGQHKIPFPHRSTIHAVGAMSSRILLLPAGPETGLLWDTSRQTFWELDETEQCVALSSDTMQLASCRANVIVVRSTADMADIHVTELRFVPDGIVASTDTSAFVCYSYGGDIAVVATGKERNTRQFRAEFEQDIVGAACNHGDILWLAGRHGWLGAIAISSPERQVWERVYRSTASSLNAAQQERSVMVGFNDGHVGIYSLEPDALTRRDSHKRDGD